METRRGMKVTCIRLVPTFFVLTLVRALDLSRYALRNGRYSGLFASNSNQQSLLPGGSAGTVPLGIETEYEYDFYSLWNNR